jgi:hypothetical protein
MYIGDEIDETPALVREVKFFFGCYDSDKSDLYPHTTGRRMCTVQKHRAEVGTSLPRGDIAVGLDTCVCS